MKDASSKRSAARRLSLVRKALTRHEQVTFEVSAARNALILALAHIKEAQRHVRAYQRLTGKRP